MGTISAAGIIGLFCFVIATRTDNAVLTSQVANLSSQVASLLAKMDMLQMNFATRAEYQDHETRIRTLEAKRK
jgi:BMFP domain-containing protein YqiC